MWNESVCYSWILGLIRNIRKRLLESVPTACPLQGNIPVSRIASPFGSLWSPKKRVIFYLSYILYLLLKSLHEIKIIWCMLCPHNEDRKIGRPEIKTSTYRNSSVVSQSVWVNLANNNLCLGWRWSPGSERKKKQQRRNRLSRIPL